MPKKRVTHLVKEPFSVLRKSYKIGGFNFNVIPIDEEKKKKADGWCDVSLLEIQINMDMHEDQTKATLWHEILEAIDDMQQLGLKHKQIETLAYALYAFVEENKPLFFERPKEKGKKE